MADFRSIITRAPTPAHLFILDDVFVGRARQKLLEVLSLVALPALPVRLQVRVETLHFVLAFLHLHRHLRRHRGKLQLQGPSGDIIQDYNHRGLGGAGVSDGRVLLG